MADINDVLLDKLSPENRTQPKLLFHYINIHKAIWEIFLMTEKNNTFELNS